MFMLPLKNLARKGLSLGFYNIQDYIISEGTCMSPTSATKDI